MNYLQIGTTKYDLENVRFLVYVDVKLTNFEDTLQNTKVVFKDGERKYTEVFVSFEEFLNYVNTKPFRIKHKHQNQYKESKVIGYGFKFNKQNINLNVKKLLDITNFDNVKVFKNNKTTKFLIKNILTGDIFNFTRDESVKLTDKQNNFLNSKFLLNEIENSENICKNLDIF